MYIPILKKQGFRHYCNISTAASRLIINITVFISLGIHVMFWHYFKLFLPLLSRLVIGKTVSILKRHVLSTILSIILYRIISFRNQHNCIYLREMSFFQNGLFTIPFYSSKRINITWNFLITWKFRNNAMHVRYVRYVCVFEQFGRSRNLLEEIK